MIKTVNAVRPASAGVHLKHIDMTTGLMNCKLKETHDSIILTTDDFTFRFNRGSISCSGNITKGTFDNLTNFIEKGPKGVSYGERFNELINTKGLLKSLIVEPTKVIRVGDIVQVQWGKEKLNGEVVGFSKAYINVKTIKGIVGVQKMILIS